MKMTVAVIVIALALVAFVIHALVSVSRADGEPIESAGVVANFKQRLIDINKVPDPKGRGTVWTPSE